MGIPTAIHAYGVITVQTFVTIPNNLLSCIHLVREYQNKW